MKSQLLRFKSSLPAIGLILVVSAALMGAALLLHFRRQIPIGVFTRDPATTVGFPIYTGFISQLGIFCWAASAAVCLFSAKVISKDQNNIEIRLFFIFSGLLTLFLGLDDAFLFHEEIFPFHFGIPEKVIYAGYIGLVLFYLIRFYPTILKTEYILLIIALSFFGFSVGLDVVIPKGNSFLLEDSAKLIGIVSWLTYFFRVGTATICHNTIREESDFVR